jgi:hypothetical protein
MEKALQKNETALLDYSNAEGQLQREFRDFIHRQGRGNPEICWVQKASETSFRERIFRRIARIPLIKQIGFALGGTLLLIGLYLLATRGSDEYQILTYLGILMQVLISPLERYTRMWNTAYAATDRGICLQLWKKNKHVYHFLDYDHIRNIFWNFAEDQSGYIAIQTNESAPAIKTYNFYTGKKQLDVTLNNIENPEEVAKLLREKRAERKYNLMKDHYRKERNYKV